jgi:hypothetical protein
MASHEELAAMVSSAQSRSDQELAEHRPANEDPATSSLWFVKARLLSLQ